MNIYYWPSSLCEYLKRVYRYNGEEGKIIRFIPPARGPRSKFVGSLTPNGEITISVNFEGRTWVIRAHRLAIFLQTGLQFRDVRFKDGDRLNLKLSNLEPFGMPLEERNVSPSMLMAIREAKEENYKRASYEVRKEEAKQRFEERLARPISKQEEALASVLKANTPPINAECLAKLENIRARSNAVRYTRGISQLYKESDIIDFWRESCMAMDIDLRLPEECILFRIDNPDNKARYDTWPKWKKERLSMGKVIYKIEAGKVTSVELVLMCKAITEGKTHKPTDLLPEFEEEYKKVETEYEST